MPRYPFHVELMCYLFHIGVGERMERPSVNIVPMQFIVENERADERSVTLCLPSRQH